MFHFRDRTPDGALHGVFMQDMRDPSKVTTYIAEAGKTVDRDGTSYLQLSKGVLLRPQSAGDSAMVTFDDYTIDLSQFIHAIGAIKRPRERSTAQLMAPDARDRADPALLGHIRSELLDRLASPLYAFVGGLIAFAALGEARTTRQGRGSRSPGRSSRSLAFGCGIAATTLSVGVRPPPLRLGGPACRVPGGAGADFAAVVPGARAAGREGSGVIGPTLSLYLAAASRARSLRRFWWSSSSSTPSTWWSCCAARATPRRATGILMAGLSFLRTPTIAEQAVAVCSSVRLYDRIPEPVAKDGAGGGARGGRLGVANIDAAAARDPRHRDILGRRL